MEAGITVEDRQAAFACWKKCWRSLQPRAVRKIERWVEEEVFLPEAEAIPGPYRIHRTEPVRELYRAVVNPEVRTLVIMSATQFFKSQFLLNVILYFACERPCRIVFGMPTDNLLTQFMGERFDEICRQNRLFADLIPDMRMTEVGGKQAKFKRRFKGGSLQAMSSESRTGFVSVPAKLVVLDEIDKFSRVDSIDEAEDRRKNFPDGKLVVASSPEEAETSQIYRYYLKSTRRVFQACCYSCGGFQELTWDQVRWEMNEKGGLDEDSVRYECSNCGLYWNDFLREDAVRNGQWKKKNPEVKTIEGFHISSLASQLVPLADLVRKFLSAQEDKDAGLIETMRRFQKNQLGIPPTEATESVSWKQVRQLPRPTYNEKSIPNEVAVITAAIDVQKDRFEIDIRGWGTDGGSYGLHYARLFLDLTEWESWRRLHRYLQARVFTRKDGAEMGVRLTFMDSGGLYTKEVYKFVSFRGRKGISKQGKAYFYFPIKGASNPAAQAIENVRWKQEFGNELILIGTTDIKSSLYSMLAASIRKEQKFFFPHKAGYDNRYFQSLCSEKEVDKWVGGKRVHKFELKNKNIPNEGIDLLCYNFAALIFLAGDRKEIDIYLLETNAKILEQRKKK